MARIPGIAPRVMILRAPGTNCDQETAYAFELAGGKPEVFHLNRLLENPALAAQFQILCIPGGFSYGDDICAGRIFGNQIRHHLHDTLQQFKADGKLVLGICNGFQVLLKSGILLPDSADAPLATLALNESGKYEDRWVHLRVAGDKSVFLRGVESMFLPVAHAEGKFVPRDEATLQTLITSGQAVLRYVPAGAPSVTSEKLSFPTNPNGASANIAGICDSTGRVLGLMPHPERHMFPTQHPQWTRQMPERGEGLALFENAVQYFA